MLIQKLQRLLDGPDRDSASAIAACNGGTWRERLSANGPRPPTLFGRSDYRECIDHASTMFTGPRLVDVTIYPVWVGDSTDVEVPTSKWYAVHAMRVADEELRICEPGPHLEDADPCIDEVVVGRVRLWDVGYVVSTSHYSPEIRLPLRRGSFGVVSGRVLEVVEALEGVEPHGFRRAASTLLPRPTLDVPPFSIWFEPRSSSLPPLTVEAIRAQSMSFDENGTVIHGR